MTAMTHQFKCRPEYFEALATGAKTFELRRDDRGGYAVGDVLWLREWQPSAEPGWHPFDGSYTGREMRRVVTYVLVGSDLLAPGVACLALGPTSGGQQ